MKFILTKEKVKDLKVQLELSGGGGITTMKQSRIRTQV